VKPRAAVTFDEKPTCPDGEIVAYRIGENSLIDFEKEAIGLDFEVMHSIVITKFGILAIDRKHYVHTGLRISIFDTVHKREVISTTFHEQTSDEKDGFWFKIIDDLVLPKEFKGTLLVDGNGLEFMVAKSNESCLINDGGGLIKFKKITRLAVLTGLFPSDTEDSISFCSILAGTFVYRPNVLDNHIPGYSALQVHKRLDRIDTLRKQLRRQMDLISREMEENRDILLLNLTDVYRNVPVKLLYFFKWVDDQFDFDLLVKTDDDCYLNIPSILKLLGASKLNRNEIWWYGNFRFNWPLDKFGKWAELEYSGSVYPAFACGSGYILSKEVVKWIALNSEYLHCYQGEDVSMGIWLAALNPHLERDKRWTCFKICHKDMLSLPNNSPEELVSLFNNETQCRNPCGCTR